MKKLIIALSACALLIGCTKPADQSSPVVATVDTTAITAKDVQDEMKGLPDMAKEFFKGPEGTARFVDELVKKEMLYLEAKKRGIDKDKDIEKRIEDFKKIVMINRMLEKEIEEKAKKQPTEQEIKEFYEKNKDEFVEASQIRLSQIIVKSENEAKSIMDRLQKGEDFKAVGGSKAADLGYFKRGDLSPQLENVAFRLRKGQVSPPIPMKDGIHFILVTDIKGNAVEFDKAKAAIAQRLMVDRQKTTFDKFIEDVKKNYKVDIKKDELAKISGAPAAAPAAPAAPQKPAEAPAAPQKPAEAPAAKPADAPKTADKPAEKPAEAPKK